MNSSGVISRRRSSEADVAYRMALDAGFALNESLSHIENAHTLHEQKRYREAKRRLDTGRKIADRIRQRTYNSSVF